MPGDGDLQPFGAITIRSGRAPPDFPDHPVGARFFQSHAAFDECSLPNAHSDVGASEILDMASEACQIEPNQ